MSEPKFLSLEEVLLLHEASIAEAQAFLDGNKRTALWAALTFLEGNGVTVNVAPDALYDAMIAIAEKRMTRAQLAELLRSSSV